MGSVAAWPLSGSCPCSVVKTGSKSVRLSDRERVYDDRRRQRRMKVNKYEAGRVAAKKTRKGLRGKTK